MITERHPKKDEERMISFTACAGAPAGKDRFAGCKTCEEAVRSGFQRGECRNGCVGVGDCVTVCFKGARHLVNGRVVVDRDKCDGCGDCVQEGVCPQGLTRLVPTDASNLIPCSSTEKDEERVRAACGFGCIACGSCERACPVGAVHVVDHHAVIDYDKCVGCMACTAACRKKIIVDTLHKVTALKETVAFVRCSGDGRSFARLKELGVQSCWEATRMDLKGMGLCTTGCLGQGECVDVCRYEAIHIVDGVAQVDQNRCAGCKDCVRVCPRGLISVVPYKGIKLLPCSSIDDYADKTDVCASGCVFCGDCMENCPSGAIYPQERHMIIDPDLCQDCDVCQAICRRGVIREQEVPVHIFLQRSAFSGKEAGL